VTPLHWSLILNLKCCPFQGWISNCSPCTLVSTDQQQKLILGLKWVVQRDHTWSLEPSLGSKATTLLPLRQVYDSTGRRRYRGHGYKSGTPYWGLAVLETRCCILREVTASCGHNTSWPNPVENIGQGQHKHSALLTDVV
jgi:hypothetical protein